jgi:hypothetical protein
MDWWGGGGWKLKKGLNPEVLETTALASFKVIRSLRLSAPSAVWQDSWGCLGRAYGPARAEKSQPEASCWRSQWSRQARSKAATSW